MLKHRYKQYGRQYTHTYIYIIIYMLRKSAKEPAKYRKVKMCLSPTRSDSAVILP